MGGVILFRLWDTHFEQSGELHTNLKLMDFYIKNCYNISVRNIFFHFRNFLLKHWNLEKNSGFFFFFYRNDFYMTIKLILCALKITYTIFLLEKYFFSFKHFFS